jgi:hypothetical protein
MPVVEQTVGSPLQQAGMQIGTSTSQPVHGFLTVSTVSIGGSHPQQSLGPL